MKGGRSNRLPTSEPPDDWVNGSWTVDCICGVNFDDGEEMVNCDECGVWVHTRCSRFVKGDTSFACDKCKSKPIINTTSRNNNNNNNNNDTEETEVAQLLVELPTKTLQLNNNNPYPVVNTPPPPPRRPYKLWTDRPIDQRVHYQGIPGAAGDPSLFHHFSSIFSSQLWKCTGYIPKKFNFCYREFPCWDKQHNANAKAEAGDTENPVDKGAGVLYSLSKETVVPPTLVSLRTPFKAKDSKWEGGDSKNSSSSLQNLDKKEKLRPNPNVLQSVKRGRDDLAPSSKDRGLKKRTKVLHKHDGSKRNKVHSYYKAVVVHSTSSARQVEEYETKAQKAVKADAPDEKHGLGEDAGSQEVASNAHHPEISNIEKLQNNVATDEGHLTPRSLEVSRIGCSSDKRVKAKKLGHDASDQTVVVPLSSLENDVIVRNPMNKEGPALHDVGTNQGLHTEPPTNDILKLKPIVEDVANAALEIRKNLDTNMLLRSVYCNSNTKSAANVDNLKGVPRSRSPNVVANSDGMKDLTEGISSADHESNMSESEVNEPVAPSCQSFEHEGREGDKDLEVSGCQYEKFDETTDSPFNIELECDGSETSLEIPKVLSNPKEIPRVAGEMSKMIGSIPPQPPVVSGGKSSLSTSTIVIPRSSISDKNRSPQNPTSTGKSIISSSSLSTKKEHAIKDEIKHEKPKSTVKDNPKSSHNPIMKAASQPSRASCSPVFKHYTSVGKDSLRNLTSKSTSVESSLLPSGVEPATSSQNQHTLHVHNKNGTPAGHRGEKNHQTNLHSSSKSSLGHLPASSNSPAGLSDEELALLLHQELNSSPRVPRVPRVRHAGSLPQLSSVSATSMLNKRTSSSGGKDQQTFQRRRNKDTHKDGSRGSREQSNEARKVRLPSSPDSEKASDALTQAEADSELLHSVEKKSVESISTSTGPSSSNANELKVSSSRDLLLNNPEDDTGTHKDVAPTHRTLPGLIAEIMGKGRRMTYEELCNAVLPHWQSLRKHNGERYAYSSHSQAVLDCLRNRSEWARLVDRGPKTNATRKKRKIDAEPPNTESEDGEEDGTFKDGESKSFEYNKEEFPKGTRKAKRGRRILGRQLQGRGMQDERKRRKVELGSDDTDSSSSNSSAGMGSVSTSDDDSQGSGMCPAKSEVSASSDGLGVVS